MKFSEKGKAFLSKKIPAWNQDQALFGLTILLTGFKLKPSLYDREKVIKKNELKIHQSRSLQCMTKQTRIAKKKMINTYNETHLHKTLKEIYAAQHEGARTEVPCGRYIADILLKDGSIIEIQTGNLSSLAPKINYFMEEKRKVRIVHPLATEKYIETKYEATGITRRKKSPKKLSLPSVFRELTKLHPFLLDRNFTLEIIDVSITEERTDYGCYEKSDNRRRRFRKTWNKTGKRLEEAKKTLMLHGKSSWKKLLPKKFFLKGTEFTGPEFYREITAIYPKAKKQEVSIMLWVYMKMNFFERCGKKGNAFVYRPLLQ